MVAQCVRGLDQADGRVVGYYALAAGSVAPADAPRRIMQGTGHCHQPVVILTRLGVDQAVQGRGWGVPWSSTRCDVSPPQLR
ncbi:hypothetical protein ACFQZ4_11725 [Catellatospora coxensis]